ncbi:MAG TPA: multicopper oxidase, partial [Candidatus Limnocylindria bacterium]|nr:multicopper oxidase [Candidatus Limnocylindria bacterium]
DYYEIAVRQFRQQVLPAGWPATTVWSYGSVNHPGTFNYPAFTLEAKSGTPLRVKWINQLMDASGNYLPHLLAVDPTLHWANPPGPRDTRPTYPRNARPSRYTGPVPIVTHLHGGHSTEESDGHTEAWFLPAAKNIPAGYFTTGSHYAPFKAKSEASLGQIWDPGTAVFQYENDQRPTTTWYHDHALGMTRLNVYAGPAGFYLIRGGEQDLAGHILPGPAPALGDSPGTKYYEIPIAIQDRAFNVDGSLFYPPNRAFFDGFKGPYIPKSDISPIWNPEFFGNTMVVNGKTWPNLEVEPRRYRFRFLNGCNSRFLILKLVTNPLAARPAAPALPFVQIGTEGGFLPAPVVLDQLLMGLAERADVIVDFSGLAVGTQLYLINEGPDEPFAGGFPFEDFEPSDPSTTGQVMKFTVVPSAGPDKSLPVDELVLPALVPLGPANRTRKVSLNEAVSQVLKNVGPREALLGIVDDMGFPMPMLWMDEVTEDPMEGDTEIWEIYNFTADAHPIHLHEVQFQVVDRQALVADAEGMTVPPARLAGPAVGPEAWEVGFKDTVIAYPGQVTRIKATFDIPGLFVWHCHIVEHEDNEMMRPLLVRPRS